MIIETKKTVKRKPQVKRKSKQKINVQKYLIWFGAILAIIGLFYYNSYQKNRHNYSNIKKFDDENIVFPRFDNQDNVHPIIVPYININDKQIANINNEILNYAQEYANYTNNIVTYQSEVNGNILSILVFGLDNTVNPPVPNFLCYNIDLKDIRIISNKELLNAFNVTESNVENIISTGFKNFYKGEVQKRYLDQDKYDFNEFLKLRGVTNYMDNLNYYIKSGRLLVYKPFLISQKEKAFYGINPYEFVIVE